MSSWEYKVITSGKGGFATPALLEKFLNDLGRDQWEIVDFHTHPDNFLAFTGLARRTTQRDWTLEDAAAAAAKAEAEKLRAEFEAKFKAATSSSGGGASAEERAPSFLEEKASPDDGFRKPVDTSRDDDPESEDEEKDDWDKLTAAEEDELPTFFEAIKPHMRRNQRGPGMSVGVDYLAKKWDQSEDDLHGALVECGFVMPEDEDSPPVHLEYDGDLYWLNINRRGELWINTKEKPRPVFRSVKAQRITLEEPAKVEKSQDTAPSGEAKADGSQGGNAPAEGAAPTEGAPAQGETPRENQRDNSREHNRENQRDNHRDKRDNQRGERGERGGRSTELPQGPALLAKVRPQMRRNRRGPGGSGSATFLARALRCNEQDLRTAFGTVGLVVPASSNDKPVYVEIGNELWWLNLDSRGGLWINGREKRDGETAATASEPSESSSGGSEAPAADGQPAVPVSESAPMPAGGVTPSEGVTAESKAPEGEGAPATAGESSSATPAVASSEAPASEPAPAEAAAKEAATAASTSAAPASAAAAPEGVAPVSEAVAAPAPAGEAPAAPTPSAPETAPASAPSAAVPEGGSTPPMETPASGAPATGETSEESSSSEPAARPARRPRTKKKTE